MQTRPGTSVQTRHRSESRIGTAMTGPRSSFAAGRGHSLRVTFEHAADPLYFLHHVVNDVTRLEVIGQNVPRVGFNLQLAALQSVLMEGERLLNRKSRG